MVGLTIKIIKFLIKNTGVIRAFYGQKYGQKRLNMAFLQQKLVNVVFLQYKCIHAALFATKVS